MMGSPDCFLIENFSLQCGVVLPQAKLVYQTYGELNSDRSNVILYLVPAQAIDIMANGAGFAGFAAWLDMTPANPDLLVGVGRLPPDHTQSQQSGTSSRPQSFSASLATRYSLDAGREALPKHPSLSLQNGRKPIEQTPRLVLKRVLNIWLKRISTMARL